MARTPLAAALKRLFLAHDLANARGVSPEAIRDAAQEARVKAPRTVSRRAVIAGAGAGALSLALPRRASAAYPTIAIVGGGIAGLTCAVKLADRGVAATVYEASSRPGGRMFSNTSYWAQGQVSEWCGELIDTSHKEVQHFAQRFGLPLDDLLAAQPAGSEDTFYFSGKYYTQAQADADFAPVYAAASADLKAAGYPTTYDSYTATGAMLDTMSIYDWIESRVPGGHKSPLGKLLDVAYAIEYGADTTDQSALNILYLLAYQPKPKSLAIFGESDERYHIRGGNQRLPEAMAASLGSAVQYGYSLLKIKRTAAGRYTLTFARSGGTVDVTVDYVVLAIPFAVLRDLDYSKAGFDPLKIEAIQDLGRGHNGKTQLQFNNRFWTGTGAWPGIGNGNSYSDTGYQNSWEVTRAQPGTAGILDFYTGGTRTDQFVTSTAFNTASNSGVVTDVNTVLAQANPVFPGIASRYSGKATQSIPHKSPFFKASYAYWRVGQYTGFSGYEGARQGGVLFCGEHTSQDFQGYMEGGCDTGKAAAKDLAQLINAPNSAAVDAL
jgi:monoamine oxidase